MIRDAEGALVWEDVADNGDSATGMGPRAFRITLKARALTQIDRPGVQLRVRLLDRIFGEIQRLGKTPVGDVRQATTTADLQDANHE